MTRMIDWDPMKLFCFNSDPKRVRGATAQSALKPGATLAVIALQA